MPTSPSTLNVNGKTVTLMTASVAGVWSTNCGTLWTNAAATIAYSGTSVASVYHKAQNKTSTGTISCTGQGSTSVTITGVLPFNPNFGVKWQVDKRGIITNVKRDGSRTGRILGSGSTVRDMTLTFNNRTLSEYTEMEQFISDHYPHLRWIYADLLLNINNQYQFISPLRITAESYTRLNYEVDIVQV